MSQYQNIIKKIKKNILNQTILTDVGSTKESSSKQVKKLLDAAINNALIIERDFYQK